MIRETIRDLTLKCEKGIHIQDIIDELQDLIVDSIPRTNAFDTIYKNKWSDRILLCAEMENASLVGST